MMMMKKKRVIYTYSYIVGNYMRHSGKIIAVVIFRSNEIIPLFTHVTGRVPSCRCILQGPRFAYRPLCRPVRRLSCASDIPLRFVRVEKNWLSASRARTLKIPFHRSVPILNSIKATKN